MRFEQLIERHHDEIYRYLWRWLAGAGAPDPALDAQDLTQEVFLRAYRAFRRLRPGSNHRAWLYRIATNCALTALRRQPAAVRQAAPLPDDECHLRLADAEPGPEQTLVQRERLSAISQAITRLPARQQGALVMRYLQGLDYAVIAGALGCSEDSARASVYQAIQRLRRELGEAR